MTEPSLSDLADLAHRLADLAAIETTSRFRTNLAADNKQAGGFDPVTEADRAAERAIRRALAEALPDHGILGEEEGETLGKGPYRWVVDPIDGTRAFICGVPVWTTLIGLERDGLPVFGVIDQPVSGERWAGGPPLGAALTAKGDTQNAAVSGCENLAETRVMVTDLRHARGGYLDERQARDIGALAEKCRLLRQGLDSYAFGLLASGHMDLVVEAGLSWYDVCGVIPVVEAAGGVLVTWDGAPLREQGKPGSGWDGTVIAAATPALAEAARAQLKG